MTARKYLSTRGCSAWRSWAAHLVERGGEVRFFIGTSGDGPVDNPCNLNLVVLQGVEDEDYPPQRKSFGMFQWMEAHYGNTSSWFMRADDDVFINVDRLLEFLSGINPREPHFLGQAGRGRGEEEGHLSLLWNQNFCMGGTGMLLSRTTLKYLVPKISSCLSNLLTGHEDVEVGRCVTLATGQTCTWAYEMQSLFYHSAGGTDERGQEVRPDLIHLNILRNAITIHPVKSPRNMEALSLGLRARQRLQALTELRRLQYDLETLGGKEAVDNLEDLPRLNGTWEFIYGHNLYSTSKPGREKRKIPTRLSRAIDKIICQVVEKINKDAREKGRTIEFRDLYYAYVNHNPRYGNAYILDILLVYKKFQGKKMTIKVRRHVFAREILLDSHVKYFSAVDTNPSAVPAVVPGDTPNFTEDERRAITMLITVAGGQKLAAMKRFFRDYEKEVLLKMNPVKLVIVVYREHSQDTELVGLLRSHVQYLEQEYPGYSILVVEKFGRFSRGLGLTTGLSVCQEAELLLVLDVDISFKAAALENVRRFTAEGRSVYFPIVWSEFRDGGGGYWRDFGYGIMAGYKKDILSAGGYKTDIQGWGKEDVDLYDKLLKSGVQVFRSIDPNLVHKYHKVTCSGGLAAEQAGMCAASRANTFLPLDTLYNLAINSSLIAP